jgi:hypothetical protein
MARGADIEGFAGKLRLAMRRASLSGTQLAHDVGVDKSVVTRWLAGALRPAEHSLASLSACLAERLPGFCRADWDLPEGAFAARLGVEPAQPASRGLHDLLAPQLHGMDQAAAAATYGGLWATFAGSPGGRGRLFGYASLIETVPGATALRHDIADSDSFFAIGSMIAFGPRLFRLGQPVGRQDSITFMSLNGVAAGRAAILEGFALAHGSSVEATPTAIPVMLLRLADSVDEASFAAARRVATHYNEAGWEAALPEPLLERFRLAVPAPPAPTILRRPLAESWAIRTAYLNEPAMAPRKAALEAVRQLYAAAG